MTNFACKCRDIFTNNGEKMICCNAEPWQVCFVCMTCQFNHCMNCEDTKSLTAECVNCSDVYGSECILPNGMCPDCFERDNTFYVLPVKPPVGHENEEDLDCWAVFETINYEPCGYGTYRSKEAAFKQALFMNGDGEEPTECFIGEECCEY